MYDQWRPRHKQHLQGVHAWQVTDAPVLKLLFNIFISLLCCNKKKPAIYGGTRVSKTKNPSSPQSIYNKKPQSQAQKRRPCYVETININHKSPALSRPFFHREHPASVALHHACILCPRLMSVMEIGLCHAGHVAPTARRRAAHRHARLQVVDQVGDQRDEDEEDQDDQEDDDVALHLGGFGGEIGVGGVSGVV